MIDSATFDPTNEPPLIPDLQPPTPAPAPESRAARRRDKRRRHDIPSKRPPGSPGRPRQDGEPPRLYFPIDANGHYAPELATDTKREQLRHAFATDAARAALGTPAPAATDGPGAFDPSLVGVLYDTASTLFVGIARRQGYTAEQADILRFTDDEKAALADVTLKVANKHVGEMSDEIVLVSGIAMIVLAKITALRRVAAVRPFPQEAPASSYVPGSAVAPA